MRSVFFAAVAIPILCSPVLAQQTKQPREKPASSGGACVTYERCKAHAAKNGFSDAESTNWYTKNCPQ